MKKYIVLPLTFLFILSVTLTSCEKEDTDPPTNEPPTTEDEIHLEYLVDVWEVESKIAANGADISEASFIEKIVFAELNGNTGEFSWTKKYVPSGNYEFSYGGTFTIIDNDTKINIVDGTLDVTLELINLTSTDFTFKISDVPTYDYVTYYTGN